MGVANFPYALLIPELHTFIRTSCIISIPIEMEYLIEE